MRKDRLPMTTPSQRLRALLAKDELQVMPCCFDALSARLIEKAGFDLTFMSGFSVAAARLAGPDTGLISFGEMLDQGRSICDAVDIPVIGDADTGYGNPMNVRRTVESYARAGFAAVMIEDQVAPKRCGHTRGKDVVARAEAALRIRAAVDARESGADVLIMARTDARFGHGLEEAIERCQLFADLGADILFLEAPQSEAEMEKFCQALPALPKLANIVEDGDTPALSPERLEAIGFKIAAYPVTLVSVAARAMQDALAALAKGQTPPARLSFKELQALVGFPEYDAALQRYAEAPDPSGTSMRSEG
jgi:2-methylisocitrate lyase-like PEP mutase family enzyme